MKVKSMYTFAELPETAGKVRDGAMLRRSMEETNTKSKDAVERALKYVEERFGIKIKRDEEGEPTEEVGMNLAKGRVKIGGDTYGLSEELAEELIVQGWKADEIRARLELDRTIILNTLYSELMKTGVSAKEIEQNNWHVNIEEEKIVSMNPDNNPIAKLLGTILKGRL